VFRLILGCKEVVEESRCVGNIEREEMMELGQGRRQVQVAYVSE
jgi:hypothetical protein